MVAQWLRTCHLGDLGVSKSLGTYLHLYTELHRFIFDQFEVWSFLILSTPLGGLL